MAEHILLVEDEEKLARMVELELQYEGYEVEKAFDGRAGLDRALSGEFDLVLLDIMLPALSGMEVLRRLRRESAMPVIMLTARDTVVDKVSCLDMGADDYITKPFRIRELTSRIRSVLRRAGQGGSTLMEFGPVQINAALGKVYKNGQDVFLSALEYRLLMTLANHAGQVLSRNQLLESIWDVSGDFVNDNTLTVYIKRLREKIEDDPQNPVVIETARGLGYRVGGRR